jgi:hypothetical protein
VYKKEEYLEPAYNPLHVHSLSQIISHDNRYTDRKGKPIPLDQTGKNHHDCLCLDYERNRLKKADFASHNHDNSTIGKCQPRQTTLLEFMDGQGASNERIMDHGGGSMLR